MSVHNQVYHLTFADFQQADQEMQLATNVDASMFCADRTSAISHLFSCSGLRLCLLLYLMAYNNKCDVHNTLDAPGQYTG